MYPGYNRLYFPAISSLTNNTVFSKDLLTKIDQDYVNKHQLLLNNVKLFIKKKSEAIFVIR